MIRWRSASSPPTSIPTTTPSPHFRRRFLPQIEALFVQVLGVAREMGVLKLGTVALDGTKIHANASRHSALSYEHASRIEAQLKAEVADLLGKAEAADQAEVPDGMQVPEELARREKRLAEIARAKAVIEARAKERHARERAEYEAKMAARDAKAAQTGKKPGGRVPQPPVEGPLPTDQVNLTDEESRIMPVAGGGFEQCYNAQAAVAADSLLVVAVDVVQAPNDKQQLEPMLDKIAELPAELGKVGELLADNGYFSEGNVNACAAAGIEPVIAMGREAHHPTLAERFAEDPAPPEDPTPVASMRHRLQTKAGKARYALRKQTPEPVFGIIKSVLGFRQFLLRGLEQGARRVEPRDHGVEHEADVRPGGGELSRIVPFAIRFGAFARGKPCVGMSPREVKHKSQIPAPRQAPWCLEMRHADDDFLISGKSTPTGC